MATNLWRANERVVATTKGKRTEENHSERGNERKNRRIVFPLDILKFHCMSSEHIFHLWVPTTLKNAHKLDRPFVIQIKCVRHKAVFGHTIDKIRMKKILHLFYSGSLFLWLKATRGNAASNQHTLSHSTSAADFGGCLLVQLRTFIMRSFCINLGNAVGIYCNYDYYHEYRLMTVNACCAPKIIAIKLLSLIIIMDLSEFY